VFGEDKMKKKDDKTIIAIILLLLALLLIWWFVSSSTTITEHKQAADISKNESGTGLDLKLYDINKNEIEIPDWFATATESKIGTFTVVSHPPAPTCTTRTQCSGYDTNSNIDCWNGKCVLQNVSFIDFRYRVYNSKNSGASFLNVSISSVYPSEFDNNLLKTKLESLLPGQTAIWESLSLMDITVWEGTLQKFDISISGIKEFTGEIFSVSDSITLSFNAETNGDVGGGETPFTEGFVVSIISPVPA